MHCLPRTANNDWNNLRALAQAGVQTMFSCQRQEAHCVDPEEGNAFWFISDLTQGCQCCCGIGRSHPSTVDKAWSSIFQIFYEGMRSSNIASGACQRLA